MKTLITLLLFVCFVPSYAQTSWKKLETPTKLRYYTCQFSDEKHGIVGTAPVPTNAPVSPTSILKTEDGGNTWSSLDVPAIVGLPHLDSLFLLKYYIPSNVPKNMLYFDYHIVQKKSNQSIYFDFGVVSYNGGESWTALPFPDFLPFFHSMYPIDASTFMCIQDSCFNTDPLHSECNFIFHISTDTGQTWKRLYKTSISKKFGSMHIIPKDSTEIFAIYYSAAQYSNPNEINRLNFRSADWQYIGDITDCTLTYLYGNTIGCKDSISLDGGKLWIPTKPKGAYYPYTCDIPFCYGFDTVSHIAYSRDRGFTWQLLPDTLPSIYPINNIAIPVKNVIYAVTTDGNIFKSTTGGGLYPSSLTDPYFSMYPNPAAQTLHWNVLEGIVVIFDALGRKVQELPASSMQADISGLAIGVYYLTIRSGGESMTKVFSVMR